MAASHSAPSSVRPLASMTKSAASSCSRRRRVAHAGHRRRIAASVASRPRTCCAARSARRRGGSRRCVAPPIRRSCAGSRARPDRRRRARARAAAASAVAVEHVAARARRRRSRAASSSGYGRATGCAAGRGRRASAAPAARRVRCQERNASSAVSVGGSASRSRMRDARAPVGEHARRGEAGDAAADDDGVAGTQIGAVRVVVRCPFSLQAGAITITEHGKRTGDVAASLAHHLDVRAVAFGADGRGGALRRPCGSHDIRRRTARSAGGSAA